MGIMSHAKFHFNRLMLTLIFGIRASEFPWAWQTTEKAGPDRVNPCPPKGGLSEPPKCVFAITF